MYVNIALDTALQNSVPRSEMITSGQTISGKQHIQFLCYGCRFFVTDWNQFWPFSEEITYGKNVLVTLRFHHGYQINTYLAENLLWNWNTFHCHLRFSGVECFFSFGTCHTF